MNIYKFLSTRLIFNLLLIIAGSFFQIANADSEYPVGIKSDLPYITVYHQGQKVRLNRIQDTTNRLSDDFTRTSRPCPPFCIWPMFIKPGINPVGELEVVDFLNNQVKKGDGFLVDARLPSFYEAETIPGSINIPWVLFANDKKRDQVFKLLGVNKLDNGKYDFSHALELCLFCSGPSCGQSPRAINALYKAGYPSNKLKYYRGGLQLWKLFGFITIISKDNIVGEKAANKGVKK